MINYLCRYIERKAEETIASRFRCHGHNEKASEHLLEHVVCLNNMRLQQKDRYLSLRHQSLESIYNSHQLLHRYTICMVSVCRSHQHAKHSSGLLLRICALVVYEFSIRVNTSIFLKTESSDTTRWWSFTNSLSR